MTKGQRIIFAREKTGKNKVKFADAIGVSKQTLYKYENDMIGNIPQEKIEAIAEVSGVSRDFLMGWSSEYIRDDLKELKFADAEDVRLIKAYHSAPEQTQQAIRLLLGL